MNNENLKPATKGEIRNPYGRPPKLLSQITKDLKERGFEQVKNSNVIEAIELLLGLTKEQIRAITTDNESPSLLSIVGEGLLSDKSFEILEKMLERAHGKTAQRNENVNLNINANEVNEKYTKDQLLTKIKDFERILAK